MRDKLLGYGARLAFGLAIFAVLVTAILLRPPKWLGDFDQSFYLSIAYDLDHHGVFSNGVFDRADRAVEGPRPGMFFGPVYPWLIFAAARIDRRFAAAVDCSVEATYETREGAPCEAYARPVRVMHGALLALGVVAIAVAAELMFASAAAFWLAGILATVALLPDADLFSFAMTESVTFSLYSVAALALLLALRAPRLGWLLAAGCLLGLLALTRPSFVVLAPVAIGLLALNDVGLRQVGWRPALRHGLAFAIAWTLVVGPWLGVAALDRIGPRVTWAGVLVCGLIAVGAVALSRERAPELIGEIS